MNNKDYQDLFERYEKLSNDELQKIINSGDDYTDIAKQVANDILNSDRTDYYNNIKMAEQKYEEEQKKILNTLNHPLYEDIHQIAGDIRFLKNLVIVLIVLSVLAYAYLGMTLG